eukprot:CAMPEP_0198732488 /NCGR_PEP_ID=MMETSP1475-20131203/36296_1 /TAXON_ID= ORGANISM="Unidentified sp., Strain CCMP1999" /NCGR_SAMPLE_ID=MMETSP1475 /ASSEMBLY_ACC=CAM_ASM_001111 /LENGTH=491 /DNA_ID=CAMNT_0044495623 /DNA_START=113 /DNA_END=1588 /DNA_ORIENTATION=+
MTAWLRAGRFAPSVPKVTERSASSLSARTINPLVRKMEYAVRGRLYIAAVERSRAGKRVIYTNIGNPHALHQQPITFFRQVIALVQYPGLLRDESTRKHFPQDALNRAEKYLKHFPGGSGAYQDSRGNECVRQEVASYLTERDGFEAQVKDLFLTDGASAGVNLCMRILISGSADGVLTPTPQYPLYSATIDLLDGTNVSYYLDESHRWGLSISELNRAAKDGRARGADIRALVVINPGNPTGQCLSRDNIVEIARWCRDKNVVIFADEVYQTNVYAPHCNFNSFRKVILEEKDLSNDVECFSFNTISKGVVGECGHRGGYFHCLNIDNDVAEEVYKLASTTLCSNTTGQLLVGLMSRPPQPGDESYNLYKKETEGIFNSLKKRAERLADALNKLEGVSCNPVEGALYAFPQISLPTKAIEAAREAGVPADTFYCLQLLDETGLCTVPGSGFGQQEGTFHFRTTILPPEEEFDLVVNEFSRFHKMFLAKYK